MARSLAYGAPTSFYANILGCTLLLQLNFNFLWCKYKRLLIVSSLGTLFAFSRSEFRQCNGAATGANTTGSGPAAASTANTKSVERLEEERRMFEKARRSLRIWPLKGETNEEIKEAVSDFCYNALLLPVNSNLGIESVARVRSSPRGQSFMEVVVVFEENYYRDKVLACGPKLAGYRDDDGRPTCGLRLQIPGHLMSQFKTLESFAFSKKRDFNGRIKKHIKFDDASGGLFIQMKHLDDQDWSNFSYDQALQEQEKGNARRVKKSLLLRSPEPSTSQKEVELPARKNVTEDRRKNGSFTPIKRTQAAPGPRPRTGTSRDNATATGTWRPGEREEEDMDY